VKPVVAAFAIGLGVGLAITAVRVVVRARRGLPTTWSPDPSGSDGAMAAAESMASLIDRVRSALADGAQAMRDTEAELRAKVFDAGR
jgi:hypothetical protein